MKKKRNKITSLKNKCWKVFSEYIRRRDKAMCVTCGRQEWNTELGEPNWKVMNAGHYRHGKLDFDEMNVNCQCPRCNVWLSGNLGKYTLFLIGKYGESAVRELDIKADNEVSKKWSIEELESIINYYTDKLNTL